MGKCKCWKECYNIEDLDDVLNVAINRMQNMLSKENDLFKDVAYQCALEAWKSVAKWKEKKRANKGTWTM